MLTVRAVTSSVSIASVWEQYHPYVRAQETANKCDVRWFTLASKAGVGIRVEGAEPLSVSAWNFPQDDLLYVPSTIEHRHGGCVDKKDMVWVNIDHLQMGVGGDNTGALWCIRNIPSHLRSGAIALLLRT